MQVVLIVIHETRVHVVADAYILYGLSFWAEHELITHLCLANYLMSLTWVLVFPNVHSGGSISEISSRPPLRGSVGGRAMIPRLSPLDVSTDFVLSFVCTCFSMQLPSYRDKNKPLRSFSWYNNNTNSKKIRYYQWLFRANKWLYLHETFTAQTSPALRSCTAVVGDVPQRQPKTLTSETKTLCTRIK